VTRQRTRHFQRPGTLLAPPRANEVCLELEDHSIARRSAIDFFGLRGLRDPQPQAARMAEQFVSQNRSLLSRLDVRVTRDYDGSEVRLQIESGSAVGAIPLISPTTARPDYGLVIQPRFPWPGIGPMLAEMGWRVCPTPLPLPLLRRSERRVPVWVLSFMILVRLKGLLDCLDRRFELVSEVRRAPRGTIRWAEYAVRSLPAARLLSVPCTFPDLRDDRFLKGAIRFAVERQLQALETQKEHGAFVHRLIEEQLIVLAGELEPAGLVDSQSPIAEPALQAFHDMEDLLLLDPIHDIDLDGTGWPKSQQQPALCGSGFEPHCRLDR